MGSGWSACAVCIDGKTPGLPWSRQRVPKLKIDPLSWAAVDKHLCGDGRWAFAEFTEIFQFQTDFKAAIDNNFNKLIDGKLP
jgi:hypothetical protein